MGQAGLELRGPPAFASRVMGLKAYITMPSYFMCVCVCAVSCYVTNTSLKLTILPSGLMIAEKYFEVVIGS